MPNWCDNILTISHEDKKLIKKAAEAFNNEGLLNYLYPIKNFANVDRETVNKKWGTRSDISNNGSHVDVDEAANEGQFTVRFETAWSPPVGVYEKAEERGFKIKAFYFEQGNLFAGVWQDGDDDYYDLEIYELEELKQSLPQDLDECFSICEFMSELDEEEE
jgi:hypothetical protein